MELQKENFDYYYLITCSRGFGTETMTVEMPPSDQIEFVERQQPPDKLLNFKQQFEKFGVFEAFWPHADEGVVIAVPKGTKPLKQIYEWLKWDISQWRGSDNLNSFIEEVTKTAPEIAEATKQAVTAAADSNQAYLSACIRAFLPDVIPSSEEPKGHTWTSCDAWRKLEIEIPSKKQFEQLMEATGETAEQLGKWKCAVLQEAAKRYLWNTLTDEPFFGC